MNVNTVSEDVPSKEAAEGAAWNRLVLEYEQDEKLRNPLPPVGGPVVRDRQEYVPKGVETYLKNRFGPDVDIGIGSRFGKPDGSGYSYDVYLREKGAQVHLAEMSAARLTIDMLPPGYSGSLTDAFQEVQQRNRFLTKQSRPEQLERTLWVMRESPRAQHMHVAQMRFSELLKFESLPRVK
jgi:hypothetical protein